MNNEELVFLLRDSVERICIRKISHGEYEEYVEIMKDGPWVELTWVRDKTFLILNATYPGLRCNSEVTVAKILDIFPSPNNNKEGRVWQCWTMIHKFAYKLVLGRQLRLH